MMPSATPDPPEFLLTRSLEEIFDYLAANPGSVDPPVPDSGEVTGHCHVCGGERQFRLEGDVSDVNWRETLRCPDCGLINRWRGALHIFESLCRPDRSNAIYLTEAISPLFRELRARYPGTIGSEYDAARAPGEEFRFAGQRVRMEDVTRLSFADRTFDAVLSFDVLEHVPNYCAALAEFHRVLRPGGHVLLSAPFCFAERTEVRASLRADGSIEHHLPPDYHGDPLSQAGVLCFQSFGMDLLQALESAGFDDAQVCCYTSRSWGYAGRNIAFIARRLPWLRRNRARLSRWFRQTP